MNHLHWRVCALLCCATVVVSAPVARAQGDFLSPGGYPAPAKTPEDAALNFYAFLSFANQEFKRSHNHEPTPEPDPETVTRLLGSVPLAQFVTLFTGANAQRSLPILAEQALGQPYDTQVRGTSAGQTIVSVSPASSPKAREVVVLAQDGGFRVDVKATYGRWNNLSGPQLETAWLKLTGTSSPSDNPFARVRDNARRASCQSNMKQMMLGVIMYEQDHDEKAPPARKWIDAILPYVKAEQAFQCPSLLETKGGKGYGYAFNQNLSGISLAAMESPATTVNIYETSNPARNWFGPGTGRAYRHGGGSNIAFADGHIKWFAKGKEDGVTFKP